MPYILICADENLRSCHQVAQGTAWITLILQKLRQGRGLSWDLDSAVGFTKDPCWILFFFTSERKIGLNMSTFVRVSSRGGVNLRLSGNGVMLDS